MPVSASASAAIIVITPSKDNTLYEYDPAEGDHSNGAGFHFFAGENGMGELRRGVLSVRHRGNCSGRLYDHSRNPDHEHVYDARWTARTVELHKLLADWGEGTSTRPERKATERRLRLTMPHGDTVSSTRSFGLTQGEIFPPR